MPVRGAPAAKNRMTAPAPFYPRFRFLTGRCLFTESLYASSTYLRRHGSRLSSASAQLVADNFPLLVFNMLIFLVFLLVLLLCGARDSSSSLPQSPSRSFDRSVSKDLFFELEELSRLVAISYCVGNAGIQAPFECLNHCSDFRGFALVTV